MKQHDDRARFSGFGTVEIAVEREPVRRPELHLLTASHDTLNLCAEESRETSERHERQNVKPQIHGLTPMSCVNAQVMLYRTY
jgi:hypothetical protein